MTNKHAMTKHTFLCRLKVHDCFIYFLIKTFMYAQPELFFLLIIISSAQIAITLQIKDLALVEQF